MLFRSLVDLAGDAPAALGLADPSGPGVSDWATSAVGDVEALGRLSTHVADSLHLASRGSSTVPTERLTRLYDALSAVDGEVVVDLGVGVPPTELGAGHTSLLVVRTQLEDFRSDEISRYLSQSVLGVIQHERSVWMALRARKALPTDSSVMRSAALLVARTADAA